MEGHLAAQEQPAAQHPGQGPRADTNGLALIVQRLHNEEDRNGQIMSAMEIKELVLPSHAQQKINQELVRRTPGALEGLARMVASASPQGMYEACFALAQLAWSNETNSREIPRVPGLLDALSAIFHRESELAMLQAQEQAAVAIGNCCANSRDASEVFANHDELLEGFVKVLCKCKESRVRETAILALKNCAASSQEAAFVICRNMTLLTTIKSFAVVTKHSAASTLRDMAVGALNSFSRSPRAVPLLNAVAVVPDVLQPALYEFPCRNPLQEELVRLTITSAVANLSAEGQHTGVIDAWTATPSGERAVMNLVKCLGLALSDMRWDSVSFTPHSVIYPLHNLVRACPAVLPALRASDIVDHLAVLLRTYRRYAHATETLELGVLILELLAGEEDSMRTMRKGRVLETLSTIGAAEKARGAAERLTEKLVAAPMALCLGALSDSGNKSFIRTLDADTLGMIAGYAFYDVAG